MPPKALKQIVSKIESAELFHEIISGENKLLNVIDLHMNWCGHCNGMEKNVRAMFCNFENAEARRALWTCDDDALTREILKDLRHGALTCRPRFLVYIVSHFNPHNTFTRTEK